jgi:hypothetical protein
MGFEARRRVAPVRFGGPRPPTLRINRLPAFKQDLPNVSLDGWEATESEIDMLPGRVGPAHRHPGFLLVERCAVPE